MQQATFGGGCFWCTEAIFQQLKGVKSVTSGYSGGSAETADYQSTCSGTTGHAEVIQIEFDESTIPFDILVKVHLTTHDPTTLNRQGADTGSQYRSVIFYHDDEQEKIAKKNIEELGEAFDNPIVTTLEKFEAFYEAEKYHQDYYRQNGSNPYCHAVIIPKLAKFRDKWREWLV